MTRGGEREREREREMCRENGTERDGAGVGYDTSRLVSVSPRRRRRRDGERSDVAHSCAPGAVVRITLHPSARGPPPPRLTLRFTFHFPSSVLSPSKGKVLSAKGCLEGLSTHLASSCTNRRGPPGRRPGASPPRSPPRCERAPGPARARGTRRRSPSEARTPSGSYAGRREEERRSEHDRREGDATNRGTPRVERGVCPAGGFFAGGAGGAIAGSRAGSRVSGRTSDVGASCAGTGEPMPARPAVVTPKRRTPPTCAAGVGKREGRMSI